MRKGKDLSPGKRLEIIYKLADKFLEEHEEMDDWDCCHIALICDFAKGPIDRDLMDMAKIRT